MYTTENIKALAAYVLETAKELGKKEEEEEDKNGCAGGCTMINTQTGAVKNIPNGTAINISGDEVETEEEPLTDSQVLLQFYRQLEAIRFEGFLFDSILELFQVNYSLMSEPLDELPVHFADAGILSQTLVKWRCTNNI